MSMFGKSAGAIRSIWHNMGHKDGDAFNDFWAEQNAICGRPIPGRELDRRYELIKRAQNGELISLEEQRIPEPPRPRIIYERDPGEEG